MTTREDRAWWWVFNELYVVERGGAEYAFWKRVWDDLRDMFE